MSSGTWVFLATALIIAAILAARPFLLHAADRHRHSRTHRHGG